MFLITVDVFCFFDTFRNDSPGVYSRIVAELWLAVESSSPGSNHILILPKNRPKVEPHNIAKIDLFII